MNQLGPSHGQDVNYWRVWGRIICLFTNQESSMRQFQVIILQRFPSNTEKRRQTTLLWRVVWTCLLALNPATEIYKFFSNNQAADSLCLVQSPLEILFNSRRLSYVHLEITCLSNWMICFTIYLFLAIAVPLGSELSKKIIIWTYFIMHVSSQIISK